MTGLVALLRSSITPVLEELIFRGCGLGEKELNHLSYAIQDGFCPTLRILDLSDNAMKTKGIIAIRRMLCKTYLPCLEVLDLSDNRLGDGGITELGNASDLKCLSQIKILYLCRNQISDEGASCIYLYIRNKLWSNLEQLFLDGTNNDSLINRQQLLQNITCSFAISR